MYKFYDLESMTQEDLNGLALERNILQEENNRMKDGINKIKKENKKIKREIEEMKKDIEIYMIYYIFCFIAIVSLWIYVYF